MSDQIGKLQELQAKRGNEAKLLAEQLGITLLFNKDTQTMMPDDLETSIHRIVQAIKDKEETLNDFKASEEATDVEFQQKIDKIRDEKTSAETNLNTQRLRISTLNSEQNKLRAEIQAVEASMPNLKELIENIAAAEMKLEKYNAKINVEDLQEQRAFVEIDKNELEIKLEAVEKDVEMLQSISMVTNELESKQRELIQNQNDLDRTKNKHSSTLKLLFPSKSVNRNYKNVVQMRIDELKSEVNKMVAASDEARMKKTRLQTRRDHLREEHKRKQKELAEITEKIDKLCDGRDYMDVLTSQKEKVEKLTMELAYHQSSDGMFKHYKQEIEQEPCCPLCHKNLDANEGDELKGLFVLDLCN